MNNIDNLASFKNVSAMKVVFKYFPNNSLANIRLWFTKNARTRCQSNGYLQFSNSIHVLKLTSYHGFESASVTLRNGIPELRLAEVQVVDGIQVHVLYMPRKGSFPHSKVKIGRVHTRNFNLKLVANPL